MGIQLINQSAGIVTDLELGAIAHACRTQLYDHVAPAWKLAGMSVQTLHHPTWFPFYIVDEIPEAPGALAYHDVGADGRPYGRIGAKTAADAGVSLSSTISHEAVELMCDRYCQLWAFSRSLNSLIAYEACDPVEADSYMIDGIEVSNFITPWWFVEDGIAHQYDYMHKLTAPFTMTRNGYLIKMKAGAVTNVFGDGGVDLPYLAAKTASRGRTFWRAAQAYALAT